jgi:phosphoribosyl-ATP pyrophosphohydrolase
MIIPSIDLMNGKAVQLEQGKKKVLEEENIEKLVEKFKLFPETNIIDLDAAMGKGENKGLVKRICGRLRCNVGGGISTKELAYEYLRAGAKNIIIGTCATKEFLKQLPQHRVIVALDVKKGKIAVEGWQKTIEGTLKEKIKELEGYCSAFLITNVDVEGMNKGADKEFIKKLKGLTGNRLIVAGGIASYEEVNQIDSLGFDQVLGMSIYTGKVKLEEAMLGLLDFSKGMIPTIAQDEEGNVLMLGYSNEDAVKETMTSGLATYFSRSRNELWKKGMTSGHLQEMQSIKYDCDADTLVYTVRQKGKACHTGKYTCFEEKGFGLGYLLSFLRQRIEEGSEESYTVKITDKEEKLHKKLIEEAFEVTQAKEKHEKVWEVADLLYFTMVYMAKHGLEIDEIVNELSLRHKEVLE